MARVSESRTTAAARDGSRALAFDQLDQIALGVWNTMNAVHALGAPGDAPTPEQLEVLRQNVRRIQIAETGYVYVLDTAGHYVISAGGKRDGELIWGAKDADGRLFIQDIIHKAEVLSPGSLAEDYYPWKNAGDADARMKVARIAYFEPWGLVIGAGSYLERVRVDGTDAAGPFRHQPELAAGCTGGRQPAGGGNLALARRRHRRPHPTDGDRTHHQLHGVDEDSGRMTRTATDTTQRASDAAESTGRMTEHLAALADESEQIMCALQTAASWSRRSAPTSSMSQTAPIKPPPRRMMPPD